jgi:hypothetical protein
MGASVDGITTPLKPKSGLNGAPVVIRSDLGIGGDFLELCLPLDFRKISMEG